MGSRPLEFIPLDKLQSELDDIILRMNNNQPFEEDRFNYLLLECLEMNPEHRSKKEEEDRLWRLEMASFGAECLQTMRSFIPPVIFTCIKRELKEHSGYSMSLTNRLVTKKFLWLVCASV